MNYFFTVCTFAASLQYFLSSSKRLLLLLLLLLPLFLPLLLLSFSTQRAQRTSRSEGRDGGRSRLTWFYPSTRRTSAPPSRARPMATLLRSTGKNYHIKAPPRRRPHRCLIAAESSPRRKRPLITLIAIDLSQERRRLPNADIWRETKRRRFKEQSA